MDAVAVAAAVEHHLGMMEQVMVHDPLSAHAALGHALAAVGTMNQGLSTGQQTAGPPDVQAGGVIDKLEDWIKRLLNKLTEVVTALAKGASFSLSVGTSVSVTISFPAADRDQDT